jgi:hypothetical protein
VRFVGIAILMERTAVRAVPIVDEANTNSRKNIEIRRENEKENATVPSARVRGRETLPV